MSVLDEIYGTAAGHEKVAGVDDHLDALSNMSAFDYVQQLDEEDFEKVASVVDPNADLSQVSALDLVEYMVKLEEGGPEKLAGLEDVDLSQIPAEELAAFIAEQEHEQEKVAEHQLIQEMIEDGDFGRADMAGRIMARAQVDELQKLAAAEDEWPDEIDLDGLSGADLEEILATGEYELVKEAAPAWARKAGAAVRDAYTAKRFRGGRATMEESRKARKAGDAFRNMGEQQPKRSKKYGDMAGKRYSKADKLRRKGRNAMIRGAAETGAAYALPAGAIGGGGYFLGRRGRGKKKG